LSKGNIRFRECQIPVLAAWSGVDRLTFKKRKSLSAPAKGDMQPSTTVPMMTTALKLRFVFEINGFLAFGYS
jgi:hypothetical protein